MIMQQNKKCDARSRTPNAATKKFVFSEENLPLDYFIPASPKAQPQPKRFFEKLLPQGRENAISCADLMTRLGLSDSRTLRRMIAAERQEGSVILSCKRGYFRPDFGAKGKLETGEWIAVSKARALSQLRGIKSARQYLDILDGQQTMDDADELWSKDELRDWMNELRDWMK